MSKIQSVLEYLLKHGPSLTSSIAASYRKSGISDTAARQRLSRLPSGVMVLRGLSFPKRARFIYLERQFGSEEYWSALLAAIKESNPAYAAAIAAVQSRGGFVRRRDFDVISGSPLRQKKQISSNTVLERLCAVSLLEKYDDTIHGECVVLANPTDLVAKRSTLRARLLTEDVLLDAIRLWAGKMNLASPNVTQIRSEADPQFATFRFDLCGPSYLRPIRQITNGKPTPGFFVADVALGTRLDEDGVSSFLRKCTTLSNLRATRPFLPMLIADSFSHEALNACRGQGIIATTPATLFGEDVAAALTSLMDTLNNAAVIAATNPDQIEKIFHSLSSIEGPAGNLRGALFELLVGHMVRSLEGASLEIGSTIYCSDGKAREMDVRLFKEKNVTVYECKGYQPDSKIDGDEIQKWLKKVSFIYEAHKTEQRFLNSNLRFEFWTCGTFNDDATSALQHARDHRKKCAIGWKNGTAVREYAKGIEAPGIRKILEEHYFNHPINFIRKAIKSKEGLTKEMSMASVT